MNCSKCKKKIIEGTLEPIYLGGAWSNIVCCYSCAFPKKCQECQGKGEIFSSFYFGNGYECSKCGGKGLEK